MIADYFSRGRIGRIGRIVVLIGRIGPISPMVSLKKNKQEEWVMTTAQSTFMENPNSYRGTDSERIEQALAAAARRGGNWRIRGEFTV